MNSQLTTEQHPDFLQSVKSIIMEETDNGRIIVKFLISASHARRTPMTSSPATARSRKTAPKILRSGSPGNHQQPQPAARHKARAQRRTQSGQIRPVRTRSDSPGRNRQRQIHRHLLSSGYGRRTARLQALPQNVSSKRTTEARLAMHPRRGRSGTGRAGARPTRAGATATARSSATPARRRHRVQPARRPLLRHLPIPLHLRRQTPRLRGQPAHRRRPRILHREKPYEILATCAGATHPKPTRNATGNTSPVATPASPTTPSPSTRSTGKTPNPTTKSLPP